MISIFAKPTFLNINPSEDFSKRTKPIKKGVGHLMRVSSMIRGDQIADSIGAKFNPQSGYENDVCIYVKPMVRIGEDFNFEGRVNYIDIVDGHNLGQLALRHPNVKIITCSESDRDAMRSSVPNEVILIPQHHCNYNREIRERSGITRMGVIGTRDAFPLLPENLKGELLTRGIELVEFSQFYSRQDIIDFYKSIDLQIVWRPYHKTLSNPLKIVNASSFGIPTIALDEPTFKEMEGCYIPVSYFGDFLEALDSLLASKNMYQEYSLRCLDRSKAYHIDEISKLYKQLDR